MLDYSQQQELVQNERNFRLLADAMPQIVWTARPDGWLDYYNQKWFEYTGMTFVQTQGWGWASVLHPDDLQQCLEAWMHSVKTGEHYEIEYRLKHASDSIYRWHLSRALPVKDAHGTVVNGLGAVQIFKIVRWLNKNWCISSHASNRRAERLSKQE